MPDETTTAEESKDTTSTEDAKNTEDSETGADTQTAKTTEDKKRQTKSTEAEEDSDKQFSQEQVNKIVAKRIDKAVRRELIKRGIDPDDKEPGTKPTVDQLNKRAEEAEQRLRVFEARDQLETFISDKRNNVQVRNVRGLFKYIKDDLEFDDDGNVTNFKDVLAQAKNEASEFFGSATRSIDAGAGGRQNGSADMNALLRHAAGRQ